MNSKLFFTYGTLCSPKIIKTLLGYLPKSKKAVIKNYCVFEGNFEVLKPKIKVLLSKEISNKEEFKYAFIKKTALESKMPGKVYFISKTDEKILDRWELYPQWYKKGKIKVFFPNKSDMEAYYYYTKDVGKAVSEYNWKNLITHDLLESAKKVRKDFLTLHADGHD